MVKAGWWTNGGDVNVCYKPLILMDSLIMIFLPNQEASV